VRTGILASTLAALGLTLGLAPAAHASVAPIIGPITNLSQACSGQNAEVEQAVDPVGGEIYEAWIGCDGIGFARSTDSGRHFDAPMTVPGSADGWDPAITVARNGTVYVAYMTSQNTESYPVVAASFDHGRTFPRVSPLVPGVPNNWGDRDFIAVGPDGSVYVTWDYGPSADDVTSICTPGGSCAFATGDLNVVIQKSTDGGRTWGRIIPVSPGFPASGGDSAPLVIEPNGRIDLEYQGYQVTNPNTFTLAPAHSYFTSSTDGGRSWSSPVRVGPDDLTMSLAEWWIDGSLGIDRAGDLYITWDTQGATTDTGWLSFSTDHGRTWSPLVRVTPDTDNATHIVQVTGGAPGIAYVGWLSDNSPQGYAQYVRPFAIGRGWLSDPVRVSSQFGDSSIWPGDTFGISTLPFGAGVAVSWGSAVGNQPNSEIFGADVLFAPGYRG